jgi:hypothetical protein
MSTVNSRMDRSQYFTASPSNRAPSKFWGGGFGGDKSTERKSGPIMKKNPGLYETRNDVKSKGNCPFCG